MHKVTSANICVIYLHPVLTGAKLVVTKVVKNSSSTMLVQPQARSGSGRHLNGSILLKEL